MRLKKLIAWQLKYRLVTTSQIACLNVLSDVMTDVNDVNNS